MAYNTTPTHGRTARAEKNNVAVGHIDSWDLNLNMDTVEISSQGDTTKTNLPGQYGWSGTIAGKAVMGNTEQKALHDAALAGTKLTDMKWLINGSTEGWDGDCYVNSMSINANKGDSVKINFGILGDGALALSDAQ